MLGQQSGLRSQAPHDERRPVAALAFIAQGAKADAASAGHVSFANVACEQIRAGGSLFAVFHCRSPHLRGIARSMATGKQA